MPGSTSKAPRDWVEADILDLITNGVKEDINLDYKACDSLQKTDSKKAEISKDVSAFANAAGGTIVYGVVEDGHVPTGIDVGFDPDPRTGISKEWLESVINGSIKPRLGGVAINQVELTAENPGRVLYVVDIPQTIAGGPHQAKDYRYYKRFNFESVPMEDYEIRDVMRRALGPDLYCTIRVGQWDQIEEQAINPPFAMSITVGNHAPEPALYAHFDVFLDEESASIRGLGRPEFTLVRRHVGCEFGAFDRPFHLRMTHLSTEWVAPNSPPLWRGIDQRITTTPLRLSRENNSMTVNAVIVLNAPHMVPRTYILELKPWHHDPEVRVAIRDDLTFKVDDD